MSGSGSATAPSSTLVPANTPFQSLMLQLVAGAGSGAFSKTATAPLERIKIIFQVQGMKGADLVAPKYTGIVQTFWLVMKEEGPFALWKGNGANVLRVIPVYGALVVVVVVV